MSDYQTEMDNIAADQSADDITDIDYMVCISYGCKDIAVIYYDYCLECIIVGSEE